VAPQKQKMLALRPAGQDQVISLDATRSEFLIGRPDPAAGINPEIDLGPFNANGTLSRRHARILREGSLYFLQEENGVANGTHLNGERLQPGIKVPVKPGDKLRFGLIEVDLISV
jgi:pSer/pThr/pTyr-binding forkhead associated (FHA) protein